MQIEHIWNNLTDAQATIIAALLTGIGFLIASIIGIATIPSLVRHGEKKIEESTKKGLKVLERKFASFEKLSIAQRESEAFLKAERAEQDEPVGEQDLTQSGDSGPQGTSDGTIDAENQSKVKQLFRLAKFNLEMMATAENVDGRTRAAYARIDRRNYRDLIDKLRLNKHLKPDLPEDWKRVVELGSRNKRGHYNENEIEELNTLAKKLNIENFSSEKQ